MSVLFTFSVTNFFLIPNRTFLQRFDGIAYFGETWSNRNINAMPRPNAPEFPERAIKKYD